MGRKKKARSEDKSSGLKPPLSADRISSLPWPILDNILCRLPIREVVRTSILSKEWQYKWVNLSELVFDNETVCELGSTKEDNRCSGDLFTNFVYHVLLSHCGQIQTLKLDMFEIEPKPCHLDTWMQFLTRKGIKRLIIYNSFQIDYVVPDCVYDFEHLTHLQLEYVELKPSNNCKGFRKLIQLELGYSAAQSHVLTRLIGNCPNLTTLVLKDFSVFGPLEIQALKLRYIYLDGAFQTISLEKAPNLVEVNLNLGRKLRSGNRRGKPKFNCNLLQNLGCLSFLEELNVSRNFLKFLSTFDVSKKHVSASRQFRELNLYNLSLRHLDESMGAFKLLGLFSNLRKLSLSFSVIPVENSYEDSQIRDALSQLSCWFNALQTVVIHFLPSWNDEHNSWHLEMEFVKFVLARSSVLEKMTLVSCMKAIKEKSMFMKELLLSERASTQARIVCLWI